MQPTLEQQIAVLDRAREKILANPEQFEMGWFHSPCGTAHCIAGWIRINEDPCFVQIKSGSRSELKKQSLKTEDFAESLVPDFMHMFHTTNAFAIEWLESREYAKALEQ